MTPTAQGLAPVIQFLAKDEGPRSMIDAVDAAFDQRVVNNWDLALVFEPPLSLSSLAAQIGPSDIVTSAANFDVELDNLLRSLFREYNQVTINRIIGHIQNCLWVEIFAYHQQGTTRRFLLAIGMEAAMRGQHVGYATYAPAMNAAGAYQPTEVASLWRLSAKGYEPIGAALDELQSLRDFYLRQSSDVLCDAVARLYSETLRPWHDQEETACPAAQLPQAFCSLLDLREEDLSASALSDQLLAIASEPTHHSSPRITLDASTITLNGDPGPGFVAPNPTARFAKLDLARPSVSGVRHGAVDLDTVLLTAQGHAWLIGHAAASIGPLLYDFLSLEAEILCELLGDVTAQERYVLTKGLYTASALSPEVWPNALTTDLSSASATKAADVIRTIRTQAAAQIGPEIEPYFVGLWYCYFKRVLAFDGELRHSAQQMMLVVQSVLGMALISERLSAKSPSLVLDHENRQVLINDRSEGLTPQDYQLLDYLFQNKNRTCSRRKKSRNMG